MLRGRLILGFTAWLAAVAGSAAASAGLLRLGDVFVTNYSVTTGGVRFDQAILRIDPATGDRTVVSGAGVGGGVSFLDPRGVAVRRQGDLIVAEVGRRSLVSVNPVNGRRTTISSAAIGEGPAFSAPFSILPLPNGDMYVSDITLDAIFFVDGATGDRTIVASGEVGGGEALGNPTTMTFNAAGRLIVGDQALDALLEVDLATGDRTIVSRAGGAGVGSGPALQSPTGMALASSGALIVADNAATPAVLAVDLTSGDRTVVAGGAVGGGVDFSADIRDLALETSGAVLVVDEDNDAVVRVNPITGLRSTASSASVGSGPLIDVANGIDAVTVLPGDFNSSGTVDVADLDVWEEGFGADFHGGDFLLWQRYFGAGADSTTTAPEPTSMILAAVLALLFVLLPRPRRRL